MALTTKLEALSFICFAGFMIIAIIAISYPTFEFLIITIAICVIFFVVLISNLYIGLKDKLLESRKLPWWNNIGVSLMALGILLYTNLTLAISAILTGLIILLFATFYKERTNSEVASDTENQKDGAEGEI